MQVALSIAGSDSGGGAGIQADLRTFAALQVFGTSAVTALTAQNTTAVMQVMPVPPQMLLAQIEAVLDDFPVNAAKTGMLGATEVVDAVARLLSRRRIANLVVDPVMVSKSGVVLLAPDAVAALKTCLVPLAAILTPNIPEAEALWGRKIATMADVREAAKVIAGLGAKIVVVKGGHFVPSPTARADRVEDVIWDGHDFTVLSGPRIATTSTHGTGCTLSAAITAWLARGAAPLDAIRRARRYLEGSLLSARPLGHGHGPTHHMHPYYPWESGDQEEG